MIAKDLINMQRIKAWIYEGVEIELELCALDAENKWIRDNKHRDSDDIIYNRKRIIILQAKLEMVNSRIEDLQLNG